MSSRDGRRSETEEERRQRKREERERKRLAEWYAGRNNSSQEQYNNPDGTNADGNTAYPGYSNAQEGIPGGGSIPDRSTVNPQPERPGDFGNFFAQYDAGSEVSSTSSATVASESVGYASAGTYVPEPEQMATPRPGSVMSNSSSRRSSRTNSSHRPSSSHTSSRPDPVGHRSSSRRSSGHSSRSSSVTYVGSESSSATYVGSMHGSPTPPGTPYVPPEDIPEEDAQDLESLHTATDSEASAYHDNTPTMPRAHPAQQSYAPQQSYVPQQSYAQQATYGAGQQPVYGASREPPLPFKPSFPPAPVPQQVHQEPYTRPLPTTVGPMRRDSSSYQWRTSGLPTPLVPPAVQIRTAAHTAPTTTYTGYTEEEWQQPPGKAPWYDR